MVIHDMRNPTTAIKEGMKEAIQILKSASKQLTNMNEKQSLHTLTFGNLSYHQDRSNSQNEFQAREQLVRESQGSSLLIDNQASNLANSQASNGSELAHLSSIQDKLEQCSKLIHQTTKSYGSPQDSDTGEENFDKVDTDENYFH